MPVMWLAGFRQRPVTNRRWPRRPQYGRTLLRPVDKIVLHTTEGVNAAGAFAAYDARAGAYFGGVHPHITVDPHHLTRWQHIPLTRASYSLKAGDRDGVIQIEIVGFARDTPHWPASWLDWIGAEVIAPIVEAAPGIPLDAPAAFLTPAAGTLARPWPHGKARLSPAQWASVKGILGHQHPPRDDHWDPGGIPITAVLNAATPSDEEPGMETLIDTTTDEHWVAANGKADKLSDPSTWMTSWVGPTRKSANMRHVIPTLYDVVG